MVPCLAADVLKLYALDEVRALWRKTTVDHTIRIQLRWTHRLDT